MAVHDETLPVDNTHRLRPMTGRDPHERGRTATTLELLYDLVFTVEQLQRQLIPGLRTPGEIAEHIVFGRALHLHRMLGERAAVLIPLI